MIKAPAELAAFIQEVIETNRIDAQAIKLHATQRNLPDLARMAHRIKGAAKYVDGFDLVKACENLEESINQGFQEKSISLAEVVLNEVTALEVTLLQKLS